MLRKIKKHGLKIHVGKRVKPPRVPLSKQRDQNTGETLLDIYKRVVKKLHLRGRA